MLKKKWGQIKHTDMLEVRPFGLIEHQKWLQTRVTRKRRPRVENINFSWSVEVHRSPATYRRCATSLQAVRSSNGC